MPYILYYHMDQSKKKKNNDANKLKTVPEIVIYIDL